MAEPVHPISAGMQVPRIWVRRLPPQSGKVHAAMRRGVDWRGFALLAFGGASGLHATEIARQLELKRVVVPRVAAVLSAWGMLATDLRFEIVRSHIGDISALDGPTLKRLFTEMEAEGIARLHTCFDGPARVMRSVDMRYGEQVFEITVELDGIDWTIADPLSQIVDRFQRRHEELYTYSTPDQKTVLVNARVAVTGTLAAMPQEPALPETAPVEACSTRRIYFNEWITVSIYDFERLARAQNMPGPAIIKAAMTTVLLRPGDYATVTGRGWPDIAVPGTWPGQETQVM
jgi:N-methylhydantoinase A